MNPRTFHVRSALAAFSLAWAGAWCPTQAKGKDPDVHVARGAMADRGLIDRATDVPSAATGMDLPAGHTGAATPPPTSNTCARRPGDCPWALSSGTNTSCIDAEPVRGRRWRCWKGAAP